MATKLDTALLSKLSKEDEDFVLVDVAYSREQLQADLKQIRAWLNEQQHLPSSRLSEPDSFLETYLTGCKGSLETVKRKLDSYYTVRGYSEIYECRDTLDPIYAAVSSYCDMAVVPSPGKNGIRLFIGRFCDPDPDKFDYLNFARTIIYRSEVYLRLCGYASPVYLAFDCKGASPSIALKVKLTILRDMVFLLQEVVPLRVIKFSFINAPSYVETLVNSVIRPFLSKKLKERLHATSDDHKDFLKYFSPSALPSDYGGVSTNPTLKELSEKWNKNEQENRKWFMNELSERTNESKRIVIDNNTSKNSYFGVHGSLKKLEID